MTKEKFRKHCEEQIERCIKLRDSKHLKEHELSLALLNECEQRKQNQENLIKYIENFISKTDYEVNIKGNYLYLAWSNAYKDLLERIKNNNYENAKD